MAEWDWGRIAVEAAGVAASGVAGAIAGAWKWGRKSAQHEHKVKNDYEGKIAAVRDEVRTDMASFEKTANVAREDLVDQFQESFSGLRRQIDEHRFYTEKDFMKKEDFRDFLKEYREDQRRTDDKL